MAKIVSPQAERARLLAKSGEAFGLIPESCPLCGSGTGGDAQCSQLLEAEALEAALREAFQAPKVEAAQAEASAASASCLG